MLRAALTTGAVVGALCAATMSVGAGTARAWGLPCDSGYVDHAAWTQNGSLDVLVITPSGCGRTIGAIAAASTSAVYDVALSEAEAKAGRAAPNRASMRDQLGCHATFAPSKPVWDLEPARPDDGPAGMIGARCNPTPTWVGAPAPNQQAYVNAFSRGGRIWGMGVATGPVHPWGPGCIQDFAGGYRGNAAIMSRGCSGPAYWVGDQFWRSFAGSFPGTASAVIGYPYNESHRWGTGWVQDFSGGQRGVNMLMQRDHDSAVHDVFGAIRTKYIALGGATGRLGFPTGDAHAARGAMRQDFAGGASIVWDPVNGARTVGPAQQLVFFDNVGTVNSILVNGPNQDGVTVKACVQTPGHTTVKANWWWAARTTVLTYAATNCTGYHPTVTLWIDPDGATPYRCLADTPPYSDWSCKP
jgi:hypothetical protein